MVIEPARKAGRSWFDIAKVADQDVMAALHRFGEQRIKLDDPADAPLIINNLHDALDRRLAEIHPDAEVRQRFVDAVDARNHVALAEHLANAADSQSREQVMGALINAKSNARHLGFDIPKEPAPTPEQLDLLLRSPNPSLSDSAVA
jgi:hypothetical protein